MNPHQCYLDFARDYTRLAENITEQIREHEGPILAQAVFIRERNLEGDLESAALETRRLDANKVILDRLRDSQTNYYKLAEAYVQRAVIEEGAE